MHPGPSAFQDVAKLRLLEAAAFLRISPWSLANRTWRQRHQIPTFRVGRRLVFDRGELDSWLARHREESA